MDASRTFSRYLADHRLKITAERLAIARAVAGREGHFDVDSLLQDLRERKVRASRATIYRTLAHLLEAGLVHRVTASGGVPLYESMAGRGHHHHMVCLGCGALLEFSDGPLEELQRTVCERNGFRMTDHTLRIEGYCRRCDGHEES
ncbi:MAG: transcriptional repressor [Acidobacteriota bacterium]